MKRAIVVGLAIFGAAGLLAHIGLQLLLGSTFSDLCFASSDVVIQNISSPDKKYKAVIFTDAGGGGFSPYCITIISVGSFDVDSKFLYADDVRVAVMGCSGFSEAKWLSKDQLQIEINPTLGAQGVDVMKLKAYGDGANIKILYVSWGTSG